MTFNINFDLFDYIFTWHKQLICAPSTLIITYQLWYKKGFQNCASVYCQHLCVYNVLACQLKFIMNYQEDVEPNMFQQEHHKSEKIQQEHHKKYSYKHQSLYIFTSYLVY